jgi:1,4-dihydroxy-2-naphthoate octaprenyltransferase
MIDLGTGVTGLRQGRDDEISQTRLRGKSISPTITGKSISMPDSSVPEAERTLARNTAIWWQTARPRTLPAILGPVVLGQALVPSALFSWPTAILCVVCALSLQIAVNLANDLFDGLSGVDQRDRLGPARALQSGWLTASQLRLGLATCLGISVLTGLWLIVHGHWLLGFMGLAAILAVLGYSGGRRPYANRALGEVAVWFFFGPVAVLGGLLAQQAPITGTAVVAATLVGLPVAAILIVNNLRDRFTDQRAGKFTLAVRLGRVPSLRLFGLMTVVPVAVSMPLGATHGLFWLGWSLLLVLGLLLNRAMQTREGAELNPLLGATALFSLLFALWLVAHFGIAWS